jgi:hypothetical protein
LFLFGNPPLRLRVWIIGLPGETVNSAKTHLATNVRYSLV